MLIQIQVRIQIQILIDKKGFWGRTHFSLFLCPKQKRPQLDKKIKKYIKGIDLK